MKICYCNVGEKKNVIQKKLEQGGDLTSLETDLIGWKKGGYDIKYA